MTSSEKFVRHLLECHCILKLFQNKSKPLYHKFPVFSLIDEEGNVEQKYVSCNNCGAIHEVIDACKSDIKWGGDMYTGLVVTKDDIIFNLQSNGKENVIDYLSIDLEGIDFDALMSINMKTFDIKNISIEFIHLTSLEKKKMIKHLNQNGYSYVGNGYDHNNFDFLFKKKISGIFDIGTGKTQSVKKLINLFFSKKDQNIRKNFPLAEIEISKANNKELISKIGKMTFYKTKKFIEKSLNY